MPAKKFTRYTKGLNAQVLVPKAIAITTDASLALFIANAPLGEIGVYDGSNALHTDAIVAGEQFYFVQKRTNGLWKSPLYKFGSVTKLKTAYVAPVKCTGSIGWSGSAGAINPPVAIAAGRQYEFGILETTEGNDPFPAWNFNYTVKAGDTEPIVMQELAKLVNNFLTNPIYKSNAPLVLATVKADATYSNFAMTGTTPTITATNGSTVLTLGGTTPAHDAVVGDYISISNTGTPDDSIGDIYRVTAVAAGVSVTLNRPFTGTTQTFTEAEAEGTRMKKVATFVANGLVFTAINNGDHFRITAREDMVNATIVNLATYTRGNGTSDQVKELEAEGLLMQGNTARNTEFGDAAYGDPDKFTVDGETYNIYTLAATFPAGLNDSMQSGTIQQNVVLAVPISAGGLSASLDTLFTNIVNP